jgi:hypothetical protein|tara:strand:- start:686 stop:1135 length:450 start_codon:yes stop_codon:yes gene_type:complete
MDKDRAIITQVCAKIASDMTDKTKDVDARISEFAVLFSTVTDILIESIYGEVTQAKAVAQNNNVVQMIKESFSGSTEVTSEQPTLSASSGAIQIVGKQHGDIPDWLIKACKRDGVVKVYDNRDGLEANAKRPHFKAVEAEKAYWPPRAK